VSPEGHQFVDQVVVNRVYRGDGEQLSHVEAVGIRLVQDARGNAWCGLRDLRRASSNQSGRLGFPAPGTENDMGPVSLTCLRSSFMDTCPSRLRLDVGVVCREVEELLPGLVVRVDRQPHVLAEDIVYLQT
jgi:hypothetical protein